ncbi:MAG: hypothetical protein JST32_09130 [Bacteroidetes bacterium]|nr:hypothetical protein [Bacteroidota bacterium]
MSKNNKGQTDLSRPTSVTIIDCEISPNNSDILSSHLASGMAHVSTADFRTHKGSNLGLHNIVVKEYHQIGEQIIIKGYEVVTRDVVAVINMNDRTAKLEISKGELEFSLRQR